MSGDILTITGGEELLAPRRKKPAMLVNTVQRTARHITAKGSSAPKSGMLKLRTPDLERKHTFNLIMQKAVYKYL